MSDKADIPWRLFVFMALVLGLLVGVLISFDTVEFDIDSAMTRLDWYLEDVDDRVPMWDSQFKNGSLTIQEGIDRYNHYTFISESVARGLVTDVCTYRNE